MLLLFLVCDLRKPHTPLFLPGYVSDETLSLEKCLRSVILTCRATIAIYTSVGIYFKHMVNNNLDQKVIICVKFMTSCHGTILPKNQRNGNSILPFQSLILKIVYEVETSEIDLLRGERTKIAILITFDEE